MIQGCLPDQQQRLLLQDIARDTGGIAIGVHPSRDLTRSCVQTQQLSRHRRRPPPISLAAGWTIDTVIRQGDQIFGTVSQTQVAPLDDEDSWFVSNPFDSDAVHRSRW